jgi:hypothetical protein
MDHKKVETSAEVYAVIMARHRGDLKPFSTYSAPDNGVMMTEWGFEGHDVPFVGVETTWEVEDRTMPSYRKNERHEYWLCIGEEER